MGGSVDRRGGRARQSGQGGIHASPPLTLITRLVNYHSMIASFKDADTEALASGLRVRRFVNFESVARRRLRQLQVASRLEDLRVPPGNRLEALKGDRMGQYSIRINDHYRICFRWIEDSADEV